MTDDEIEREIADKGLVAPRVTQADIDAAVAATVFHVLPGTTVTVCLLTTVNGFGVVGHSAAVSPENFDRELGEKIAEQHARDQMWALLGYELKGKVHDGTA